MYESLIVFLEETPGEMALCDIYAHVLHRDNYEQVSQVRLGSCADVTSAVLEGDSLLSTCVFDADYPHDQRLHFREFAFPSLSLLYDTVLAEPAIGGGVDLAAYEASDAGVRHVFYVHEQTHASQLCYRFWRRNPVDAVAARDDRPEFASSVHPNPFNGTTQISFSLEKASRVSIEVFDLTGRKTRAMQSAPTEIVEAGTHSVMFDGTGMASGIYFVRVTAGGRSEVQKIVLMK